MMPSAFSSDEIDQLKRAAQMFEMILDTGAQTHEAYETLKDVYVKLGMDDDFRRVTSRFADYLLARDDHDAGVAQLAELATRYPDEAQWRERLIELGAPVPASDSVADEQARVEPLEDDVPSNGQAAQAEALTADRAQGGAEREAVQAFNQLKAIAEFQAVETLRQSGDDDLERAIGEAEKILCELDQSCTAERPEPDLASELEAEQADASEHEEAGAPEPEPEPEAVAEPAEAEPSEASAPELEPEPEYEAAAEPAEAEPPEASAPEPEPEPEPEHEAAAEPEPEHEAAAEPEPEQEAAAEPAEAEPAEAEPVAGETSQELHSPFRLGEMMVEQGVITRDNLETALAQQRESGGLLGHVLIELGYATEADVLNCLALQAGVPYLPLGLYEVQPELAALLPESFARQHHVVPVDTIANSVLVAIAARLKPEAKQELESLLGDRKANYYISAQSDIDKRLDELYPGSEPGAPQP